MNSSRILVSGVSGPIGGALVPSLKASGYSVTRLVRGKPAGEGQIAWNPLQPLAPESVSGFEAVIHLAGESVVGRWTEAKKRRILESRALGTRHLAEALAKSPKRPRTLISASASGYYGNRNDEILRENSSSGTGFLAEACRQWEGATKAASEAGIRTVNLRIGIMLSASGGALQKMLLPFRMGVGGNMGPGTQWWSWIHIQDLVGAVHHILKSDLIQGPVNAVAPRPVTNTDFTKTLGSVLSRPTVFPMPAFAARLVFGQMADELLLASQRIEPAKLISTGYPFRYPDLRRALENLLKNK
ncbi:MAG TPA: TIGR01777 family oxidoreductase [Terriglobales bacterium]|nr:MAG: TIGR01777 family protein [Acidobacteriota bacterium]HEV2730917.1 TIGR01777 family oxidoreductase [Terriglobales bacterium]